MTIDAFHFLRPAWLLALLPAAAILWAAFRLADRRSAWRGLVDEHLLRALVVDGAGNARRWPLGLATAGWLLATLAMAGPTWERVPQPTSDAVAPTVVVLDMSPSMQSDDLPPSRLARARFALQDVLTESEGGQVGLVLYSSEPYVAAPLTDDPRVIEEMIPTLTPDLMPAPGSRADRAIALATDLLTQAHAMGGRIVLLSDGVDEQPDATQAAARDAAAKGHTVSVVGIGTAAGAPVRDTRGRLVRDADGRPIVAPLDQRGLEAVADAGGGRYVLVGADLSRALGTATVSGGTMHEGSSVNADVWRDMGIWLVLALVMLAPFGFRRGWLAVAFLTLSLGARPAEASVWSDLWARPDQQGAAALNEGRPEDAAQLFDDPSWKAAAQYQSGKFDEAVAGYRGLPDGESRYNLGNALARSGKLEDALSAYDEVLAKQPEHEDARFNRDLVQKLLDQKKEQQQNEQQANDEQKGDSGQSGDQSKSGEQQDQHNAGASGEQKDQQNAGGEQRDQQKAGGDGEQHDQQNAGAGDEQKDQQNAGDQQANQQNGADAQDQTQQAAEQAQDQRTASGTQDSQPTEQSPADEPDDQQPGSGSTQTADAEPTPPTRGGQSRDGTPMTEQQQAREQMLRRIPDDPGGLLRAKIRRRYAEQRYAAQGGLVR